MAVQGFVKTTFPVDVPQFPELRLAKDEFDAYIMSEHFNVPSQVLPVREKAQTADGLTAAASDGKDSTRRATAPFMDALLRHVDAAAPRDGMMLTTNGDVAFRESGEALVDLFYELEDVISTDRLRILLEAAWTVDALATLKIIWNARSIHLGKSSRNTFYRAVGWLAQTHPRTLLANLPWLVRPVIVKKLPKQTSAAEGNVSAQAHEEAVVVERAQLLGDDDSFELVEGESEEADVRRPKRVKIEVDDPSLEFDVKYGVAHGYWKDLTNMLALAANDELKVDGNPRAILNVEKLEGDTKRADETKVENKRRNRDWTPGRKKARIHERHARVIARLESHRFNRALHVTVSRLFAEQLKVDLARLHSGNKAEMKSISLAAKWAPSNKGAHDEHTFVVSTIAELLHPFETVCPAGTNPADRTLYLKYARAAYQTATLSPLRKHLQIVERPLSANKFDEIKYECVPSLAMSRYTGLFIKKDETHFGDYLNAVADGKLRISGATLLPSQLVHTVRKFKSGSYRKQFERTLKSKTADMQWNALVQRIRDSGTLQSSIAVCDVSGSMAFPTLTDGTCPMDTAIGLSLILAEVCEPPFGGAFVTFSATPQVLKVGGKSDGRTFEEKVDFIAQTTFSMNTNFVAVFEDLILPLALQHKLKNEDMVKRVFIFSDMQFDSAQNDCVGRTWIVGKDGHRYLQERASRDGRWSTSFERIKKKFAEAGYDLPELVFWNLAGGRAGYQDTHSVGGHEAAPKPVDAQEPGTALVSGYSQAMLKVFMDGGDVARDKDADELVEISKDGEVVKRTQEETSPLSIVKKAIGHEAYRMLKVWD